MNGWQRIGVILTGLWFFAICGYAIYERSLLPIKVIGEETENPGDGWHVARELQFVEMHSSSPRAYIESFDRTVKAKTDEERRAAIEYHESLVSAVYETSLKDYFWLCLLTPIVTMWILSYSAIIVFKWVALGFANKGDKT